MPRKNTLATFLAALAALAFIGAVSYLAYSIPNRSPQLVWDYSNSKAGDVDLSGKKSSPTAAPSPQANKYNPQETAKTMQPKVATPIDRGITVGNQVSTSASTQLPQGAEAVAPPPIAAEATAPTPGPAPNGRPTILFLHGGCWLAGEPKDIQHMATIYAAIGYNTEAVQYRDGNDNILHQIENVKARVAHHRTNGPVILYGISAGGTIAAALAAEGVADGAVIVGSPTNLTGTEPPINPWVSLCLDKIGITAQDRQAASPLYRLGKGTVPSPQYLQYAKTDELVAPQQGVAYLQAARAQQPDTLYTEMAITGHKNISGSKPYASLALLWIAHRWPPAQK